MDRQQRVQQRAAAVNEAVDRAAVALADAAGAPIWQGEAWAPVSAHAERVRSLLAEGRVDRGTGERVAHFLARVEQAQRDRRIIEVIEEAVSQGASHEDRESWLWMERRLRQAFADYGIDVRGLSPGEIAARIRASDLAPQLADGYELWMGAVAHARFHFGVALYPDLDLAALVNVLYAADPDPFATRVRQLVYSPQPTRAQVVELMNSVQFQDVRPRTLAWLGSAATRTGDSSLVEDIFRRAVIVHAADFMLNFDAAYTLAASEQWPKVIRYYERCLALRPNSAGVWRSLGVALRRTEDMEGSLDALRRSVELQPDHAPTQVDLGLTLEQMGLRDAALAAYREALRLSPESEAARRHVERLE